jgi:hypothetical protein
MENRKRTRKRENKKKKGPKKLFFADPDRSGTLFGPDEGRPLKLRPLAGPEPPWPSLQWSP